MTCEFFEYKKGKQVTTKIPDPMGLGEWYGEDQASQVHRERPLDFIGFLPAPKGEVRRSGINRSGSSKDSVGPNISGSGESYSILPLLDQASLTDSDITLKEVTFQDLSEIGSGAIKTVISDHTVQC